MPYPVQRRWRTKEYHLEPEEWEITQALTEAGYTFDEEDYHSFIPTQTLYDVYKRWIASKPFRHMNDNPPADLSIQTFGTAISWLYGGKENRRTERMYRGRYRKGYVGFHGPECEMSSDTPGRKPVPPPPPAPTKSELGLALQPRDSVEPTWRAVLNGANYPDTVVVLDFETYFDDAITMRGKKLSTIEYVMHPDSEVLGVSVLEISGDDEDNPDACIRWIHGEGMVEAAIRDLQVKYGENLERCTVVAQNAMFDGTILAYKYGVVPKQFIDTLGLARHWDARNKNDLDSIAKRLKLRTEKGDTSRFKYWTNRVRFFTPKGRGRAKTKMPEQRPRITPEQQVELGEYANNDVSLEWQIFKYYLPKLSNSETELWAMQHTLELYFRPVFRIDVERAERIKQDMQAEMDKAIEPTGLTPEVIRSQEWDQHMADALRAYAEAWVEPTDGTPFLPALHNPEVYVSRYTKEAKNCKRKWKIASANSDWQREELERHPDTTVRQLMEAKAATDSWPNHIKRVDSLIRQAEAAGGKLPVPLKYCGAHTARWSGTEGLNLQNLGSRGHALIKEVREILLAPEGWACIIADASQIEARVLAWQAGEWWLVEKFAADEEIYCRFAEQVLDLPVNTLRKPEKSGGIPAVEARYRWARNSIGKVGVLGCGYGMGADRAIDYSDGSLDAPTAEKLVKTYRDQHKAIVKYWRDLEAAFKYAYTYKKACAMPRGLRFDPLGGSGVMITLPNGRELKYHNIRIVKGQYGPAIEWYNPTQRSWTHIWGGHLAENVVQAISRDILLDAIRRLEKQGRHIALHVHDELVAVVIADDSELTLQAAIDSLKTRPEWGLDLPLNAEGVISERYGAH